jgi:hypothetical protein
MCPQSPHPYWTEVIAMRRPSRRFGEAIIAGLRCDCPTASKHGICQSGPHRTARSVAGISLSSGAGGRRQSKQAVISEGRSTDSHVMYAVRVGQMQTSSGVAAAVGVDVTHGRQGSTRCDIAGGGKARHINGECSVVQVRCGNGTGGKVGGWQQPAPVQWSISSRGALVSPNSQG